MKILIVSLLFLFPGHWETNIDNVKKIAKEEHKLILLNFSGSDWCGPCIVLRKDYFDQEQFIKMADENLVLINADFPRKKKNMGSPELIKNNEALASRYNSKGSFPLTLLLDTDGNVLYSWEGKPNVSVEAWAAEIKALCEANRK